MKTAGDDTATRAFGLDRLAQFVPSAGRDYAAGRNSDPGPDRLSAVSKLSPYVRHRLITEPEIVASVLAEHSLTAAEKFVQEVLWRTYWKGWLELRPAIWQRFVNERDQQRDLLASSLALAAAEAGTTGIDGFDDWARELVETGYLHNHARMWFASIWIFTLRLPWTLGADFFLRHLIDADAASNTLSWRWVAGMQTAEKTYLATTDNIARYTGGRFAPTGLASQATALTEPPVGPVRILPKAACIEPGQPAILLVTPEDMHPESLFCDQAAICAAIVVTDSHWHTGDASRRFVDTAVADTVARTKAHFGCTANACKTLSAEKLITVANAAGVKQILTPYAPVGPVADALSGVTRQLAEEGIKMAWVRRNWDEQFWPHAGKGFFAFREKIPTLLREGGVL